METKHTSGPWTKYGSVIRSIAGSERKVADVRINDDEGQANATLIAAAPDLLAELEETHAALCFTSDYIGSERHKRNAAAIAKARSA